MSISHEEADDLLAAFAMDALVGDERQELIDHLANCRLHDRDLAENRAAVAALAVTAEDIAPPQRLRRRLMTNFDQEVRAAGSRRLIDSETRGASFWRQPQIAYALAAALLIAVVGLGAWNLSLRSSDSGLKVSETSAAAGRLRVTYLPGRKIAVIEPALPPLPPDRIYQAWALPRSGGAPVSLGLLARDGPTALPADLTDAAAVAISVEPPGGSTQPTTTPVVVDPLG